MTLHECFKQLETVKLRNLAEITPTVKTGAEWLQSVRDESGYQVGESRRNYGRIVLKTITHPTCGLVFIEAR